MKQSLSIQRIKSMPRFIDDLPDKRHYVFKNAINSNHPPDKSRALFADIHIGKSREWARNNLGDNFTIASKQ